MSPVAEPKLVRRLGLFDATMIVMGGIVGAGIFVNPAEVAKHISTPRPIVGVWLLGGLMSGTADLLARNIRARQQVFCVPHRLGSRPMTGGITCFPRLPQGDVDALEARLRSKYDTSIVAGRFFGLADPFRIGIGGPTEMVEEGLARIGAALDELA